MSAPEQKAETQPEEPPRKARWLDRAVTALLALAFAAAMAAVTPALLQAGGIELPVAAQESPGELKNHPGAPPLFGPPNLFDPDADQDDPPQEAHGQLGLARTALTLHEQPSLTAEVSGAVGAGEMVQILRVAGDWVLVYYGGAPSHDDGLVVGWAKKSEIAIR
jgi:hypothetical protein